jgi:hypothetical protein
VVDGILLLVNDDAFEGFIRKVQDASNLVERKGSFPIGTPFKETLVG